MKKINSILRKCKSLSRQLSRSSSYSTLRSKSDRQNFWLAAENPDRQNLVGAGGGKDVIIYVGSTRKKYVISSNYLSHPVLNALIEKPEPPKPHTDGAAKAGAGAGAAISVRCEVVLFDHLLWMLENSDPNIGSESNLQELAELYVF